MAKRQVRKYKVGKNGAGKRADIYVVAQLPEFTRSSLKNLFNTGQVTLKDHPIKASHTLRAGDILNLNTGLLFTKPPAIEIPILYEDDEVVVLNKPAGILTHAKGALNTEATVASFIKPKLNDKTLNGNRAGIVHRLDRHTSGVIITAKNESAMKYLQKQFSTRKANKTYLAVIEGELKLKQAIIDAPIERNPKKPQTFRVSSSGRPATTQYKVLKISALGGSSDSYSLLELTPKTGRTHQLRVHLKYIGHPILGDQAYGHEGKHMYLHAKSLELKLPGGRQIKFEAPEPKIFKDFLKP